MEQNIIKHDVVSKYVEIKTETGFSSREEAYKKAQLEDNKLHDVNDDLGTIISVHYNEKTKCWEYSLEQEKID